MKNRPLFTGIAGGILKPEQISVANLIGQSGLNTGNFLFVRALREILGNKTDVFHDESYFKEQLSEFDYIAISAANWVQPDIDLSDLTQFIESTKLPCLVVGLGSQLAHDCKPPPLKQGTQRFLEIVSERSKSISVRGQHTQELLGEYGIRNTWVTGCPSILGDGTGIKPVYKRTQQLDLSRVVVQGTRHGYAESIFSSSKVNKLNLEIYRYAMLNNRALLLQSEVADIFTLFERERNLEIQEKNVLYLEKVYEDRYANIATYLHSNAHIFWSLDDWFKKLATFDFLIGTRIHGVISAILSGIPATLLTHDERTKEMAEQMNLSFVDIRTLDRISDDVIDDIYKNASFSLFNLNRCKYQDNFRKFFEENNVKAKINDEFI